MTVLALLIDLGVVAGIGGLLSLDRRATFQFMLSQPLVAVTIIGLYFGDLHTAVMLGSLLQLLWMSCVMFGANVPHNDTLAAITIAAGAFLFGRYVEPIDSSTWIIALLVGAPTCLLGQWIDIRLDHMNLALAERADKAGEAGETHVISFLIFRAIVQAFAVNTVATLVTSALVFTVLLYTRPLLSLSAQEAMNVIATYVVPALGLAVALALLRHRRALALAITVFITVATVITQGVNS